MLWPLCFPSQGAPIQVKRLKLQLMLLALHLAHLESDTGPFEMSGSEEAVTPYPRRIALRHKIRLPQQALRFEIASREKLVSASDQSPHAKYDH